MKRRQFFLGTPLLYLSSGAQRAHSTSGATPAVPPAPFRKMAFAGKVDGRDRFTMFLDVDPQGNVGRAVEGALRFGVAGRLLSLQGPRLPEGQLALDLYEQPYGHSGPRRQSGHIVGTLSNDRLTGTWHAFRSKRTLPFDAVKTQSSTATKREALAQSVGRFRLVAISGHCCLSNDYEAQRSDRGWQLNGSSIVGGSRSGYGAKLRRESVASLNSLEIVVTRDLSVRLSAGKEPLLEVPFDETGMLLKIDKPEDLTYFKTYSPSTTFVKGRRSGAPDLVLALVSGQDWSPQVAVDEFNLATRGTAEIVLPSDGFFYGDEFKLTMKDDQGTISELTFLKR